ncbi:MAG TPA: hypothetical protein VNE63_14745 [Candidatus Acidoferrales bacterium]|nr:hypothetical protein [Candidatus Acidoferrales bacterium]
MAHPKEPGPRDNLVRKIGGNILLLETLTPIGKAIHEEVAWIGSSAATSDKGDENPLVGMACEAIENLLGLCFVICQVFITDVVSVCYGIRLLAEGEPPKKKDLLATCSTRVSRTEYTQVQATDALANYFKHRDQWPSKEWPRKAPSKYTAQVISALGNKPGSTRNFRTGFEAVVGDSAYSDVARLGEVVENWAAGLRNRCA